MTEINPSNKDLSCIIERRPTDYWTIVLDDGKSMGPIPDSKLSSMAQAGQILAETLIKKFGATEWIKAHQIKDLLTIPAADLSEKSSAPVIENDRELLYTVKGVAAKYGYMNYLSKVNKKKLANAIKAYARPFKDGEVAIALADTTHLGSGETGILITNDAIYSSYHEKPIPISTICSVEITKPDLLENQHEYHLVVNDNIICKAPLKLTFYRDVLKELIKLCDSKTNASSSSEIYSIPVKQQNLPAIVATMICEKHTKDEILTRITRQGYTREELTPLIDAMATAHSKKEHRRGALFLIFGLFFIGLPILARILFHLQFAKIYFLPLCIVGGAMMAKGLREIENKPTSKELVERWNRQNNKRA